MECHADVWHFILEKNMKKFYFVLLALGLAACGQEQSQKADAEQYFFANKYQFADEKQAFYFERAARFRVLQQGLGGDFERFLKGEIPNQENLAKYRENITQAVAYYADTNGDDDPYRVCKQAAQDAEILMKSMVTSGGGGTTDLDKESYQNYRKSMQECRKTITEAEAN
ncbi:TPA: hypothetical protein WIZ77_001452 [Neisseria meningitidis]